MSSGVTSCAIDGPTTTTAGSQVSPLVWRARNTNVLCRADAVVPTSVAANSTAASTPST